MKYKVGLIRVMSVTAAQLNAHGRFISHYFPQFDIESFCIGDQPQGVHDDESERLAIPKILKLVQKLCSKKDGILLSCAGDPGLEEAKRLVSVPLVGAGESLAYHAALYGGKLGIIGISESLPKGIKAKLALMGRNYLYRPLKSSPSADLLESRQTEEEFMDVLREFKALGISTLMYACTGIPMLGFMSSLKAEQEFNVINPLFSQGLMLYAYMVSERRMRDEN